MNSNQTTLPTRLVTACALGLTAHSLFAASTVQFSSRVFIVAEDVGQAELTVVRANDTETQVAVEFYCIEATATAGQDYTAVSGAVTFLAGETIHTISIPILNDGNFESGERFQVALTNVTGDGVLGAFKVATITIQDNETPAQLEFASYTAREDEGSVLIGIVRGGDELAPLTLGIATADGAAIAGQDYTAMNETIMFGAGENLALLTVPILNDGVKEPNEAFRVYLTNAPAGAVGTPNTATITIRDNDPGVQCALSREWVFETDGSVEITVVRGNDGLLGPFSVDYATVNGTATAGKDYDSVAGTLFFAQGEMSKILTIPVTYDDVEEADETFELKLNQSEGTATLGSRTNTTVTILDSTGDRPHRFTGIKVHPDRTVDLSLESSLHRRFAPYFDIYPIEVSTNLMDWSPLVTLQRQNSSTNTLTFLDSLTIGEQQRFYRQPASSFVTVSDSPTGPYAVGRTHRWLTDSSRRNRFLLSANSSFRLTIWYPAAPRAGCWPAPAMDEPILRDENYWTIWSDLQDQVLRLKGYAASGLEIAANPLQFPIVLVSHGYTGVGAEFFEKGELLASHGYIVIAPDHSDGQAIVFPDGSYEFRDKGIPLAEAGLRDRVKDMQFIVDQVTQWAEGDAMFGGRLDLGRIAAMGFSWGGDTALEFCRVDPRCLAAIALDTGAFTTPGLLQEGLQKPSLTINRSDNTDSMIFNMATADAVWFQISSTRHDDIGGWGWWPSGTLESVQNAVEVNRAVNEYTTWFLNKYVSGGTDPMPALADHSRIINFKQK